ncbi:MAG: hypothetical protein ACOYD9_04040 [Pyramidobacter sp.]|jgi:hypothetical protein
MKWKVMRSVPLLTLACVVAASLLTVAMEFRIAGTVKKMRETVARCEKLTALSDSRAVLLSKQAAELEEKLRRIEKLPLVLAGSADELTAAVDHCAAEVGLACDVAAHDDGDATELAVTLRASPQELFRFLSALTARRELLLVEQMGGDRCGTSLFAVQLRLKAFRRKEGS